MSELLQTHPAAEAMSDDVPRIGGIWNLPVRGPEIAPLDPAIVKAFEGISSATACAQLHRLGITQTLIEGPKTTMPGTRVVGRAVTLQFMPLREDIYQDAGETQEYVERATALWGVLDEIEPGDVLVVQAYGSAALRRRRRDAGPAPAQPRRRRPRGRRAHPRLAGGARRRPARLVARRHPALRLAGRAVRVGLPRADRRRRRARHPGRHHHRGRRRSRRRAGGQGGGRCSRRARSTTTGRCSRA